MPAANVSLACALLVAAGCGGAIAPRPDAGRHATGGADAAEKPDTETRDAGGHEASGSIPDSGMSVEDGAAADTNGNGPDSGSSPTGCPGLAYCCATIDETQQAYCGQLLMLTDGGATSCNTFLMELKGQGLCQ